MTEEFDIYKVWGPEKKDTVVEETPTVVEEKPVIGGGKRYDTGKLPLHLVPESAMMAMAKVLEVGAKKYEDRNWEKGMSFEKVIACMDRHWIRYKSPDLKDIDKESGLPHLWLAFINIAFLIQYELTCKQLDDRVKSDVQFDDFHDLFKSLGLDLDNINRLAEEAAAKYKKSL